MLAAVLVSCDAGDAPPAAVPFVPVGDVHDTMTWVIDPAADAVWGAAGFVLTEAGTEDLAPTTDADWALVQHSAAVVAASANLLLLPDALPEGDRTAWAEFATGMARIAQSAGQAAADRDAEALFQVGGQLYNVCVACHQVYDRPSA